MTSDLSAHVCVEMSKNVTDCLVALDQILVAFSATLTLPVICWPLFV